MKIAYLILAHNNPHHLRRLVAALSSSSSGFFIHLDKKSNADDFSSVKGKNVHFTRECVPAYWGDFSLVEATLILLRAALADRSRFDRFVLLSGADYPLRSAASIERFFESNPDKEFINLVAMSESAGGRISRLTTYKLRPGGQTVTKAMLRALLKVGALPRTRDYKSHLRKLTPYSGSQWWALSREACDFIVTFVDKERHVVDFFRNTHCPDESLFQTILGNSHFKRRIVRNLTYVDWSSGGNSPALITEEHLALFRSTTSFAPIDLLGSGDMLFARKFSDESADLVARLDEQIDEREGRLSNRRS